MNASYIKVIYDFIIRLIHHIQLPKVCVSNVIKYMLINKYIWYNTVLSKYLEYI